MTFAKWVDSYRDRNAVEGWVNNAFFDILKVIDAVLRQNIGSNSAGVLEIGVHHGKFFIALNGMIENESSVSLAVDLFGKQDLNVDGSGHGNLEKFKQNLTKYDRHAGRNVVAVEADSTIIDPADLIAEAGAKFRIVSVDGGHTAEHTISDIKLASTVVHPKGFVIVDDILNSHWLGVIDGTVTYLRGCPTLWPLCLGFNKLVMCPMSVHPAYRKYFEGHYKFAKSSRICGYEVLVV